MVNIREITTKDRNKVVRGKIEVRDLREKYFMMDDAYINGHARKCGPYATCVYDSLCRHASRDQECFPSVRLIADEMGISERQVKRGVKILESYKIIIVKRRRGERSIYWLTSKSMWKKNLAGSEYYKVCGMRRATKAERKGIEVTYDGEND